MAWLHRAAITAGRYPSLCFGDRTAENPAILRVLRLALFVQAADRHVEVLL